MGYPPTWQGLIRDLSTTMHPSFQPRLHRGPGSKVALWTVDGKLVGSVRKWRNTPTSLGTLPGNWIYLTAQRCLKCEHYLDRERPICGCPLTRKGPRSSSLPFF